MKSNTGTRGLGCSDMAINVPQRVDKRTNKKIREMNITKARYEKAITDEVVSVVKDEDANSECGWHEMEIVSALPSVKVKIYVL